MRGAFGATADNGPMAESDQPGDLFSVEGEGTDRIQAFSDGVFAIAITLLVLDLNLPPDTDATNLAEQIGSLWQDYLAFALSFAIIGMYWISHHNLFRRIERFTVPLLWLNLLVLASVVFIPFPTRILSDFGDQPIAIALYAGTLAVTGFSSTAVWVYAYRSHLAVPDISYDQYRLITRRMLAPTVVFALTVPIAFVWSGVMISWFLIFFADRVADWLDARLPHHEPD
jgi:uncharacterized membrane protein